MAPTLNPTGINSFKTLIVEDNAFFRQSFKDTLQTQFPLMAIEEIGDGNQVLRRVETFLPHLIFMDIQLPGENGLHLTKKVKVSYPNIFITILTSHNSPEYREAAFQAGADRFMAKDSMSWKEIEALVKSILNRT
jgi:DNA-binding NarL/FixJ family response regulator